MPGSLGATKDILDCLTYIDVLTSSTNFNGTSAPDGRITSVLFSSLRSMLSKGSFPNNLIKIQPLSPGNNILFERVNLVLVTLTDLPFLWVGSVIASVDFPVRTRSSSSIFSSQLLNASDLKIVLCFASAN